MAQNQPLGKAVPAIVATICALCYDFPFCFFTFSKQTPNTRTNVLKSKLRRHLLQTVPETEILRWYDPLVIHEGADPLEISVEFPHPLYAQWFEEHEKEFFEEQAGLFLGPGHILKYRTALSQAEPTAPSLQDLYQSSVDFPFGHDFTLESFHTNQKNLFALASARDVAKTREAKYNPLLISGEAGTGKSHLLRAIANELSKRHDQSVIFLGNVDDLAELAASLPKEHPLALRSHMSGYRFFFLDDLHHLPAYPDLGRLLLILFNLFYDLKRQMVFTSNKKASDMLHMPDSLRTRLEWGLGVQLAKPDLDVRLKFIQSHCQRKKIGLTKVQMLTLAQNNLDFRTITGFLNKYQAYRELLKRDISDSIFENILGDEQSEPVSRISPEEIIKLVAQQFGIDPRDITGSKRHKQVVEARHVAMLLCRDELGLSYPVLGQIFGGKDHSTVLYAIRKIQLLQLDNSVLKEKVNAVRKLCNK